MHIIGTNFLSLLLNGEARALEKVKKEGPENFSVGQWSLDELKISETELPVKGMHVIPTEKGIAAFSQLKAEHPDWKCVVDSQPAGERYFNAVMIRNQYTGLA